MLLELAIGDAYGAGFEYAPVDFIIQHNNLMSYAQHPSHSLKAGAYTDDTQMSLAIAELLVSNVILRACINRGKNLCGHINDFGYS